MKRRIHPLWWPVFVLSSPILLPYLIFKNESYKLCIRKIDKINGQRLKKAKDLSLPEVDNFQLIPVVEAESKDDFEKEAGISYFIETENSNLLFDIAFADESSAFTNNYQKLNLTKKDVHKFVLSHLHPDHMGGIKASRENKITIPDIINSNGITAFLPDAASVIGGNRQIIYSPQYITEDIATTGPLRANLFFSGPTEEQSLIINIKNKGAVIVVGCGHPDLNVIIEMAKRLTKKKIHAVIGGLHLPIKSGRLKKAGFDLQRIIGTGRQPWNCLDDSYLDEKISVLKKYEVEKVLLSPHDSSDYAAQYFKNNLKAEVDILKSGHHYNL
ncbi:MAG: MBL fold metallo-hydrolase [Bacillota bacterium]